MSRGSTLKRHLDLYLIHFPISLKYVPFDVRYPPGWVPDPDISDSMVFAPVPISQTWKAMEKLVDKGLVRNIGLSNWNSQGLRDIFSFARIKPSVLQVSEKLFSKEKSNMILRLRFIRIYRTQD
jgi:diketogulonate reductase-like aldo/keto reductase